MLRNRNEIREDKAFDQLTDAILQRDQPRTTDLFYRMVTNEGRSIGEALSVVTAAEAPFSRPPRRPLFRCRATSISRTARSS